MEAEIKVKLSAWVVAIAVKAARTVIAEHVTNCDGAHVAPRVEKLERRWLLAIGIVIGSGVGGGFLGAALLRAVGG